MNRMTTRTAKDCRVRDWLRWMAVSGSVLLLGIWTTASASAQERLCDTSFEDCRLTIRQMIDAEQVAIDVSFWFMDDQRYRDSLIAAKNRGVAVRVLLDVRADANYNPGNKAIRDSLIAAGIPIRHKTTTGINHWKMMLYAGQAKMHFSAANFSNGSYSPITPYIGYVDEAIYFTDDPAIVNSFMTKYDDLWTDTVHFQNLANITSPLTRRYPTYPISPDLNFPPDQDYQDRVVAAAETRADASRCGDVSDHVRQDSRRADQAGPGRRPGSSHHRRESISE